MFEYIVIKCMLRRTKTKLFTSFIFLVPALGYSQYVRDESLITSLILTTNTTTTTRIMAGKSSEGFTKAAQKQKFIRNRDIKLTNGELKKEASIQRLMCEGVCDRCREKVQWRFRYDKYKPLKTPGTCADCKQKKVSKAYRSLCDGCASIRKVCGSCCVNIQEANTIRAERLQVKGIVDSADLSGNQEMSIDDDDNDNNSDTSDNDDNNNEIGIKLDAPSIVTESTEETTSDTERTKSLLEKDSCIFQVDKFNQYRDMKYNKSRQVGTEDI